LLVNVESLSWKWSRNPHDSGPLRRDIVVALFMELILDFAISQRQNWGVNSLLKEKSSFFMKKYLDFLVQSKILP
jgi:hypothetical protein